MSAFSGTARAMMLSIFCARFLLGFAARATTNISYDPARATRILTISLVRARARVGFEEVSSGGAGLHLARPLSRDGFRPRRNTTPPSETTATTLDTPLKQPTSTRGLDTEIPHIWRARPMLLPTENIQKKHMLQTLCAGVEHTESQTLPTPQPNWWRSGAPDRLPTRCL